jgi:hypothetical protein
MPGIPNSHLPGRGITDLTSRGRYEDDLASFRKGLRSQRSIEERLSAIEAVLSAVGFLWINVEVSVDYTIPGGFYHARVNTTDGNVIVTLPPVYSLNGQMVSIFKVSGDANTVTIAPSGSDVILAPAGAEVLSAGYDNLTLIAVDYAGNRAWDFI